MGPWLYFDRSQNWNIPMNKKLCYLIYMKNNEPRAGMPTGMDIEDNVEHKVDNKVERKVERTVGMSEQDIEERAHFWALMSNRPSITMGRASTEVNNITNHIHNPTPYGGVAIAEHGRMLCVRYEKGAGLESGNMGDDVEMTGQSDDPTAQSLDNRQYDRPHDTQTDPPTGTSIPPTFTKESFMYSGIFHIVQIVWLRGKFDRSVDGSQLTTTFLGYN